jgi:hypothetical protein
MALPLYFGLKVVDTLPKPEQIRLPEKSLICSDYRNQAAAAGPGG